MKEDVGTSKSKKHANKVGSQLLLSQYQLVRGLLGMITVRPLQGNERRRGNCSPHQHLAYSTWLLLSLLLLLL